jgi:two-component system CheB/CheR fusion protein
MTNEEADVTIQSDPVDDAAATDATPPVPGKKKRRAKKKGSSSAHAEIPSGTEPDDIPTNDESNNNDSSNQSGVVIPPKLIVGLGASAGGLQPLEDFFRTVDPTAGHAYVVVQHLSPDFKSLMSELLGRQTRMNVFRIENGMQIAANSVYLIPPRSDLTIHGNILYIEDQDLDSSTGPQFPIDVFFRSLAQSAKTSAIAVILSGTGSDGSRGVRAIDEAGGMVYVQDPSTAQFDGMPNAARATVSTLQLLSPQEIATSIGELKLEHAGLKPTGTSASVPLDEFEQIIALASEEAENDFSAYKAKTLSRRVHRRMVITGKETLQHYLVSLKESKAERKTLAGDLLIAVTNFFRDEDAWTCLQDIALPQIINELPLGVPLRIWVSACSTGEEAYTMAMVAREAMEKAGKEQNGIKIFATDVDQNVLDRAAAGVYPESIVADVPQKILTKYFIREGDNYTVTRHLREMVIFAQHNMLADAPFARMHVVSCRNVLIYFQPEAQNRVLSMMHFSLTPSGVLFLGASESVGELESEFKPINRQWCIFSKLRDVRVPIESNFRTRLVGTKSVKRRARSTPRDSITDTMTRDALQTIATERNWVCLLCDGHGNVLHVLGDSQRYLQVPQGGVSAEATRMVPEGLEIPLRSALHRSQREKQTVNHIGVRCDGYDDLIDLQVIYRPTNSTTPEMYIVLIMSSESLVGLEELSTGNVDMQNAQQLNDLEYELRQTRENLQATIEELETTNEEQQATNEQLTAANEELQSTNEELHSVNEELYTVNSEYQLKINELTEVTNDIDNLLESTDIGVVFLDSDLRIRKFTPAATRDVHLLSGDIGRLFDDLTYNFDYPNLSSDLKRVLSLGEAIEREVKSGKTEFSLVRIHPYRAGSELTVGIVMTFVNISELKRVEDALAQVETRYRHLFQSEMFGITLGSTRDRSIVDANDAYLRLLDLDRSRLPVQQQQLYPDSELPELERALRELEITGSNSPAPVLLKKTNGKLVSVVVGRTLISEAEGTYVAFVLATDSLNDQVGLRLQEKAHELESVRHNLQQFAYIASHQLKEPLRAVDGFAKLLLESNQNQLNAQSTKYLNYIEDGIAKLSDITEDLLLYSRVHTHAEDMTWVDSTTLVDNAIKELQHELKQVGATVNFEKLPMVFAEASQLKQVFFSLIDNSIKYHRADQPPAILIEATQLDDNWQFSVKDNGQGIDPEHYDRIFLMFQQLHKSDDRDVRGIGLAVSKRIIERHHGRIWVESKLGKGSTVRFTLPVRQAAAVNNDNDTQTIQINNGTPDTSLL